MNFRRRSAPLCHRYGDLRERHTMNNTRTAWPGTERLEVSEIPAETGNSILNIDRFFHAKLTQPVSIGFFRRPGCTADLDAVGVFIEVGSPSALRRARSGRTKIIDRAADSCLIENASEMERRRQNGRLLRPRIQRET